MMFDDELKLYASPKDDYDEPEVDDADDDFEDEDEDEEDEVTTTSDDDDKTLDDEEDDIDDEDDMDDDEDSEGADKMLHREHHAEDASLKALPSSQVDPYTPAEEESILPEVSDAEVPVAATLSSIPAKKAAPKKAAIARPAIHERLVVECRIRTPAPPKESPAARRRRPRNRGSRSKGNTPGRTCS